MGIQHNRCRVTPFPVLLPSVAANECEARGGDAQSCLLLHMSPIGKGDIYPPNLA